MISVNSSGVLYVCGYHIFARDLIKYHSHNVTARVVNH